MLITGAAGRIGTALRDRFGDHELILTDVAALPRPASRRERFVGDVTSDVGQLSEVAVGCDLVIHLGWIREPRQDFGVLQANIDLAYRVLEGARRAGVGRFLFASSNHAVGYTPVAELGRDPRVNVPVRPDDFYGVAKAACEALCSFYADEYEMAILSARLLSFRHRPTVLRELSTWLSPGDMARLVWAAARLAGPGHRICWGVSRNTRRWASLEPGLTLGFDPRDDAEAYAEDIVPAATERDRDTLIAVGGRVAPSTVSTSWSADCRR